MAEPAPAPLEDASARALERLREVRAELERLSGERAALTETRDTAILELVAAGLSYEAVAKASGLTRGRIGQIVQRRGG